MVCCVVVCCGVVLWCVAVCCGVLWCVVVCCGAGLPLYKAMVHISCGRSFNLRINIMYIVNPMWLEVMLRSCYFSMININTSYECNLCILCK